LYPTVMLVVSDLFERRFLDETWRHRKGDFWFRLCPLVLY